MTEGTEFTIGSEVVCSEGGCGELKRVVVNPVARALTHLVVEPRFQQGEGRLVPIELVDSATGEIRLRCTLSEFHGLEEAEETHFVQGAPGNGVTARDRCSRCRYSRSEWVCEGAGWAVWGWVWAAWV